MARKSIDVPPQPDPVVPVSAAPIAADAQTLWVVAPEGQVFARELTREKIRGTQPVEVPNTSYYRRAINDGSLIAVPNA